MNLSELRAEARRIQRQTKGIYALFLVPILTAIISVVYNYSSDTFSNNILQYGIQKTLSTESIVLFSQSRLVLSYLSF